MGKIITLLALLSGLAFGQYTPPSGGSSGGATIAHTLDIICGDNAGNGADCGIAPANVLQSGGNLGTPSAGVGTNLTGVPISSGISGLGTGCATFLGTPSSANLRSCITDETGTGLSYFQGGALGTPSSGVATNLTGLPLVTGVTGLLPTANAISTTVNSVNTASGAFTCNFALGHICLVNQGADVTNPVVPTLTNLPTNAFVKFVMNFTLLRQTAWPSNVMCNLSDSFVACGTVNGYSVTSGKYSTTFWSDGTNLYANGDSGNIQTVNAAHVNASAYNMYNIGANTAGTVTSLFDTPVTFQATSRCTNSASPSVCAAHPAGVVALAAAASTLTINTTAVNAAGTIVVTPDSTLGTALGVTCNTTTPSWHISSRTAATSFTITVDVAPITNPFCFSYVIFP